MQESKKRQRVEEDEREHRAWKSQIVDWRQQLGMNSNLLPFDQVAKELRGLESPTPRERAILNMVAIDKLVSGQFKPLKNGKSKDTQVFEALRHCVVDLSQNPCRRSFTSQQNMKHALTTSTRAVHLGEWRVVVPRELMYMQGHPRSKVVPPETSQTWLRGLAGEGMALPCLGVCIFAQNLVKGFHS